jgi:hypothetical protein
MEADMIFVYETKHLGSGKIYVGVHEGSEGDGYLGSGKHLRRAIAKHGKSQFVRRVLHTCDTLEEAFAIEAQIVNEDFVKREDTFNMMPGGKGGWKHVDLRGDKNPMRRAEVAAKVAAGVSASYTPERRLENADRMRQMISSLDVHPRKGKKHTVETLDLISVKNTGRPSPFKGLKKGPEPLHVRLTKSVSAKKRVADGFDMGSLGRGKSYNMRPMTCPHCGKIGAGGNMTRYHFDNCKHR